MRAAVFFTRLGLPHFLFSRHPGDGAFRAIWSWRRGNVWHSRVVWWHGPVYLERALDLPLVENLDLRGSECDQPSCDRRRPCAAERSGWCAHPDASDGLDAPSHPARRSSNARRDFRADAGGGGA